MGEIVFTQETATASPAVNRLSQYVFDAVNAVGDERAHMEVNLTCSETLGEVVLWAAHYATKHAVIVPKSVMGDAANEAAEMGEPVPDYALSDINACT